MRMGWTLIGAAALLGAALLACKSSNTEGGDVEATSEAAEAAPPKIEVEHEQAGGEKSFEVKSGYTYATTKTFTGPDDYRATARSVSVFLSDQELDSSFGIRTLGKPHEGDGVTVRFSLIGKEGTRGAETDSPPEKGVYEAGADKFMQVATAGVIGKEKAFLRGTLEGQVEITEVSDDEIEGTVDLSNGTSSIEGSFVARLGKGD